MMADQPSNPSTLTSTPSTDFGLDLGFMGRRHSVAVGEMDYYHHQRPAFSTAEVKTEPMDMMQWEWQSSLHQPFHHPLQSMPFHPPADPSLPSSFSSSHSTLDDVSPLQPMAPHQRAMSLCLETMPNQDPVSSVTSPTTPVFFSHTFLDSLTSSTNLDDDGQMQEFMVSPGQLAIPPSASPSSATPNSLQWMSSSDLTAAVPSNSRRGSNAKKPSGRRASAPRSLPSSPSTTSSTDQRHPSIPEEDDEMEDQRTLEQQRKAKHNLINARIAHGKRHADFLQPLVQAYLLDKACAGERCITIMTSKVAQKSYGTEKRFLCPPPATILSGSSSWWTLKDEDQSKRSHAQRPPRVTVQISGEPTSQTGLLEWFDDKGQSLENGPGVLQAYEQNKAVIAKCVSKQLHINDADEKRRRVEVLVKLQLGNGLSLGTLPSKGIKVISKPSKKRQSVKNMELCIHHGTTISLFNRIRSQTVSTKYLGVSNNEQANNGTCFVARTNAWDPFVIWIVDTSRSPEQAATMTPRISHHPLHHDFPPPPAIALQSGLEPPMAIHYNQPVVLQCVSTGLVSPVMVIRKVDKGSMVLGGNRLDDLSGPSGGECGDEALGDPVSQLHKIAFQIVHDPAVAYNNKRHHSSSPGASPTPFQDLQWSLPNIAHPVSYLACLNDVVGMHKTNTVRTCVTSPPNTNNTNNGWSDMFGIATPPDGNGGGKMVRKRRVSCDVVKSKGILHQPPPSLFHPIHNNITSNDTQRRRVNSLNDVDTTTVHGRRSSLVDHRRSSVSSEHAPSDGACWTEDVSDAAVWTIVGTDIAKYTFWLPPSLDSEYNQPFARPSNSHPITPFPVLLRYQPSSPSTQATSSSPLAASATSSSVLLLSGENMTRDLFVWFGDIQAPATEYKSRETLACCLPDRQALQASPVAVPDQDNPSLMSLPILLVRGDGIVYRTGLHYTF
ncbi:hypothetical protein DM01DRAFT_1339899 [Hesseltinella vesiculosa]|uniref:LAG1-DNAbind-domain-containing protein n=1 Tax=Hesseltinella vesiculosa TaxID=101127 RepID=A0A1X2G5K9_9FUNG|nr:hypothetical protein DM01DRAFT_1339899 [Hesseltinella vesiculosa]